MPSEMQNCFRLFPTSDGSYDNCHAQTLSAEEIMVKRIVSMFLIYIFNLYICVCVFTMTSTSFWFLCFLFCAVWNFSLARLIKCLRTLSMKLKHKLYIALILSFTVFNGHSPSHFGCG